MNGIENETLQCQQVEFPIIYMLEIKKKRSRWSKGEQNMIKRMRHKENRVHEEN